ncbi:MAG: hypothetical protein ACM3MK_06495 [Chitinophagales bacterium]
MQNWWQTDCKITELKIVDAETKQPLGIRAKRMAKNLHFSSNKPRLLRGIAQNLFRPEDILIELTNIGNTRFAKQIRQMALENLKARANNLERNTVE